MTLPDLTGRSNHLTPEIDTSSRITVKTPSAWEIRTFC
jgi:hypothetical protein